jgi:hypothetical protein
MAQVCRIQREPRTKEYKEGEVRRGQLYLRMLQLLEEYGVDYELLDAAYDEAMSEMENRRLGKNVYPLKRG